MSDYEFFVGSTWTVKDESISLKEIISIEDITNSEWGQLTEGEIGQLVPLDNVETFSPLQLIRPNNKETCNVSIKLENDRVRISKLIVISEAKIIEFYGKHGEYICTEKAQLLGNISGKTFYFTAPSISTTNEVALKLCKSSDTLWLYGVTVLVVPVKFPTSNSVIDFANVDQILRNSNVHLTEKAERAKTFIMNYSICKSNKQDDNETLENLIHKWNILGGNALSKLTSTPTVIHRSNNYDGRTENGNEDSNGDIKRYVDRQVQQLEERVQKNLQQQLKELEQKQNEKLDNIIQLLQKNTESKH